MKVPVFRCLFQSVWQVLILTWHVLSMRSQYFCNLHLQYCQQVQCHVLRRALELAAVQTVVNQPVQQAIGHCQWMSKQPWIFNERIKMFNFCHMAYLCGNTEEYRWPNITYNECIRDGYQRYWDDGARKLEDVAWHNDQCQILFGCINKLRLAIIRRTIL